MGEWKTGLNIRVRQSLKDDLQKIADREYRTLGNLASTPSQLFDDSDRGRLGERGFGYAYYACHLKPIPLVLLGPAFGRIRTL